MEQLLPHLQIGYNKTTTHWRSVNFSLRAEALIESIPGGHGFVGDHGLGRLPDLFTHLGALAGLLDAAPEIAAR